MLQNVEGRELQNVARQFVRVGVCGEWADDEKTAFIIKHQAAHGALQQLSYLRVINIRSLERYILHFFFFKEYNTIVTTFDKNLVNSFMSILRLNRH